MPLTRLARYVDPCALEFPLIDPERSEEVAPALLSFLCEHLEEPGLGFAEPPVRLFGGTQTFVHALRLSGAKAPWDGPLVLRILRAHREADEVRFESAVQNALAPLAPRVLLTHCDSEPLGGAWQIMVRLPGHALMLQEIGSDVSGRFLVLRELLRGFREAVFGPWPRLLAETHARLHAMDPGPVLRAVEAEGMGERLSLESRLIALEARADAAKTDGLRPAIAWLQRHAPAVGPPVAICHGDLFPNQVFCEGDRVTGVIDWADVFLADPSVDVGFVCGGMGTIPLPVPGLGGIRNRAVRLFREAYAALRPIDPEAFRFGEVLRVVRTLVLLGAWRAGQSPEPVPYSAPGGARELEARLSRMGVPGRFDPA